MKMKGECKQEDYIKEAFDKLYGCVMPYIDLNEFANADRAFKELDKKVHSEIYILKKRLAERDRAVEAGITRSKVLQERISELEKELAETKDSRITWRSRAQHAEKEVEDLNKKVGDLEQENTSLRVTTFDTIDEKEKEINDLKKKIQYLEKELFQARNSTELSLRKENDRLRKVVDTLEKEINSLKKKIHELEQETADDAIRIKSLERANSVLRGYNKILWSRLEEADLDISKRPWHGDGNAMTGGRTCYESITAAIEFQNKKIEELEAEKARLKEAYDIHEATIERLKLLLTQQNEIDALKKENSELRTLKEDLSYGHEFEFGDKIFVPWSDAPYMYVKTGLLYNTRTKNLVYVGKDRHLKWFGERFEIK